MTMNFVLDSFLVCASTTLNVKLVLECLVCESTISNMIKSGEYVRQHAGERLDAGLLDVLSQEILSLFMVHGTKSIPEVIELFDLLHPRDQLWIVMDLQGRQNQLKQSFTDAMNLFMRT